MPDGLVFVAAWVAADLGALFQVMECDDITLLQAWVANWEDLVEFEIVPVVSSGPRSLMRSWGTDLRARALGNVPGGP